MGYDIINFDNFETDFNKKKMFFGKNDGIQRYDVYKYEIFKKLYDAQEAARWRPQEISFTKDKAEILNIPIGHQEIYRANLLFQTFADSLANRFLEDIFCRAVTLPELEAVIKTQGNFELTHSFSYSYNIRQVYANPKQFFDEGFVNKEIQHRLDLERICYTNLDNVLSDTSSSLLEKKQVLLEAIVRQYALENIRFFVSFLYTFMLNELNGQKLQGSVNNITLILNDEVIHTVIFKNIINILRDNEQEGFSDLMGDKFDAMAISIFEDVKKSEMIWFDYLRGFAELNGFTKQTVSDFLDNYIYKALKGVGIDYEPVKQNDLVVFFESKKNINDQKAAAQETNLLSYNIGVLQESGYDDKVYNIEEVLC